jgi:hypothetical protein
VAEKVKLTATDEDSFGGGFPVAEVKYLRDENGKIKGFNISNGRARGIYFEKKDNLK